MSRMGISIIGVSARSIVMFEYLKRCPEEGFVTGAYDLVPQRARLVLQRYEGSRKLRRPADGTFQEGDSWKEARHGRRHDFEDQTGFDAVLARV